MEQPVTAVYGDYDKLYQNFFPVGFNAANPDFGGIATVNLDGYIDTTQRQSLTLSGNLVGEFETGTIGHTIVGGLEYIDTSNDNDRFNTFFDSSAATRAAQILAGQTTGLQRTDTATLAVADVIDFSVNAAGVSTTNIFNPPAGTANLDIASPNVFSAYVQNQIAVTDWLDIVVGARFDSFDFTVEDTIVALDNPNRILSRTDEEISPRLGVILKPKENISIYGSFSESFIPQSGSASQPLSSKSRPLTASQPATRLTKSRKASFVLKASKPRSVGTSQMNSASLQV